MANVFQQTSLVARDAAIELSNALRAASLIPDEVEQAFASKVGESVQVKKRPVMTANRHTTGAFTTSDLTEAKVTVTLEHRAYVKHRLTASERTFSIDDFTLQVTRPAMLAIAEDIDLYLVHDVLAPGFAENLVGTDGNEISTFAHLSAAWKTMFENKCPQGGRVGLVTPDSAEALFNLAQFQSTDYGVEATSGMRAGVMSPVLGLAGMWPHQSATAIAIGDTAGTVLIDNASHEAIGQTTIHVDGFTAATGTIGAGTRFTIAGDTQVYTITADATLASNECDIVITPALLIQADDNDALTFKAAAKENVFFHPNGVARALIPPEPQLGNPSAVDRYNGVPMRVTFESSINDSVDGDAEFVLFDVFVGGKVIVPECGCVVQG